MKHRITATTLIALIMLAFLPASGFASKVYKWVDENGVTQYSSQPPESSRKVQEVQVPPSRPASPAQPSPAQPSADQSAEEREKQAQEKEQKAKEQAVAAKNCKIARDRLRTLQEGGRLFEYDEQGERRYIDDADLPDRIAKAQADIEKWCAGQE